MANQKKTFMSVLLNGLIWENPTFVLMLGMLALVTLGGKPKPLIPRPRQ